MKKKTLLRLERRFLRLPLHHVDTSIIREPPKTENGFYCKKYLNIVGYKYRGRFSLPMLGELFMDIQGMPNYADRFIVLELIDSLIHEKKITFSSVADSEQIVEKIKSIDTRQEPVDMLIFACAVVDKAGTLVTLDENMVHNEKLEKEFNIKIRHPKELV